MTERVHLFVSGRVQGVFFRVDTQREAQSLGLVGWVRNLPDGRVEIVAQGDAEAVRALVEWSHLGPVRAEVASVDINWEETDPIDGFSIR